MGSTFGFTFLIRILTRNLQGLSETIILRTTPLVFSASNSKSKVAVGVFYVFILFDIANRASFMV